MLILLINLDRRPDRLSAMAEQAKFLGLNFERIPAVDASASDRKEINSWFRDDGPLGEIPMGDKCCLLSHRKAWKRFLDSGHGHAVFLEDDVRLSGGSGALLSRSDWLGAEMDLVKLEHFGPPGQRVLLSALMPVDGNFATGRMLSRHTGAAAYILSRRAAQKLILKTRFELPVDHLLFNPNNSQMFGELAPWQLLPAIARQREFVGQKSNIEESRRHLRRLDLSYLRREIVRFGYDLRLLPHQIWALVLRRAKFIAMKTA